MKSVEYVGKDLEAMSFASKYHSWIFKEFRPYLGKHIVEVGAGVGSFSELLIKANPLTISLVEPSGMYLSLDSVMQKLRPDSAIQIFTYNSLFTDVAEKLQKGASIDSIVYVNVMEHIEDDGGELKIAHDTLIPGGRIFLFVPALHWLYGAFDKKVGHYRRYSKAELEKKCQAAGFTIVSSRYFDILGIVPWWIKYRVLRSDSLGRGAVGIYDFMIVPIGRLIEGIVVPPFGKNILLIGEKK